MAIEFRMKKFENFITVNRWHYRPLAEKIRVRNNQILKGVRFTILKLPVNCQ